MLKKTHKQEHTVKTCKLVIIKHRYEYKNVKFNYAVLSDKIINAIAKVV